MQPFNQLAPKELAMLQPYVKDMVVLEANELGRDSHNFPFFADGLPGIMFSQSDKPLFLNRGNKKIPGIFLYGQTVKPIEITAFARYKLIIVYLYPHVIKSLFGIEASELTNSCIDIDLLPVKGVETLKNKLADSALSTNQSSLLLNFLSELIRQNAITLEKDLSYVTDHLLQAKGNIPLTTLHDELNTTERTFERKFLRHVGVSPRLFARICRFHAALSQLRTGTHQKLTDIAYDNGFADQSHLSRTFKEFTGLTPSEYLVHYQLASSNV